MAQITFKSGGESRVERLDEERTTIGLASDNSLIFEDVSVSGHHAEIVRANGNVLLRDLGSSNGTTVNGRTITKVRLKDHDRIAFGGVECVFHDPLTISGGEATTFANSIPEEELDANVLRRCGPLSNPVKLATGFVAWSVGIALCRCLVTVLSLASRSELAGIDIIFAIIFAIPVPLSIWLLLHERHIRKGLCLFLPAIHADVDSEKLQSWLIAALGRDFNLFGVCAPAAEDSWVTKFIQPMLAGLRALGSARKELTAPSRNWMARLIATFSQARFVFIDMRHVTPRPQEAACLAWETFGPDRCVFIVDDRLPDENWRNRISEVQGQTQAGSNLMIVWPSDQSPSESAFSESVQGLLASIPDGSVRVPARVVSHTLSKVGRAAWGTRRTEKDGFIVAANLVGLYGLLLLASILAPSVGIRAAIGILIAVMILFWAAWNHAHKQSRLAKRFQMASSLSRGRLWAAAGWPSLLSGQQQS